MGSQKGMSLVEILVGLVIGLLAMLAIFQTLAFFESQRRTTGEGAAMQQNGLSALYTLEQDIRLGGFGLVDNGNMPCFNINAYGTSQSIFQSVPVRIQDGGTGPDTLITVRLDSDTGGMVTGGNRAQLAAPVSSLPASITVDTGVGLHANDYIMISQSGLACSLLQVTSISGTTVNVQAVSNPAGSAGTPAFPSYSGNAATPYATIVDIGPPPPACNPASNPCPPAFVMTAYGISGGSLMETVNSGTSTPLAANIVNIQAQYGVAPAGSQSITCWTNATGNTCSPASGDWANPTSADFQRIKAIRIAVVAKSALKEKPKGSACDATTSAPAAWPSVTGQTAPPTIDLSSDANWKCYRYKVYSTIVPLRNVMWGNL